MNNNEIPAKVKTLTPSNVQALTEARDAGLVRSDTIITATTATFQCSAADAAEDLRAAKMVLGQGGRGNEHPAKSLSAVIRKLER